MVHRPQGTLSLSWVSKQGESVSIETLMYYLYFSFSFSQIHSRVSRGKWSLRYTECRSRLETLPPSIKLDIKETGKKIFCTKYVAFVIYFPIKVLIMITCHKFMVIFLKINKNIIS